MINNMKENQPIDLAGLEEENGYLAKVKVDEVLGLVGDVAAKVATNNAMPGGVILFVKLLLDVSGNVFFNIVLIKSLQCRIDGIVLHLFAHVGILHDGLLIARHSAW